jgi:WXG100 family type VII secretion target
MTAYPRGGDPGAVRAVALRHEEHAAAVRVASRSVADAVADAPGGWRGDAADAFASVAGELRPTAVRIVDRLDAAAVVLRRYATDVERIQDEAEALARRRAQTADDVVASDRRVRHASAVAHGADATESDSAMLAQLQDGAEHLAALQGHQAARWEELVAEREAADRAAASALESSEVVGNLVSDARVDAMTGPELLAYLAYLGSLDRESIAALAGDPFVGVRLARADARRVAEWCGSLGDGERAAFVAAIPMVIGNLDGVSYRDRGRANQRTLDVELPRSRDRFAALAAKSGRDQALSAAEQAEYTALTERIGALEAIRRTLTSSWRSAPLTVVALTLGRPPLAAVAVGDMDTASRVTVDVPGMGATVASGLRSWTGGALNLYNAQRTAANKLGTDRNVATVAWIGYDTPAMPPSPEVLGSAKARAGAVQLGDFLTGVAATRGWTNGQHLSVVGHSYGTTTTTLAVTHTPVENVVLLASAGVDRSIPDAGTLDVPAGHVWASQARDDFVANIGRGSLETRADEDGGSQPSVTSGNRMQVSRLPSEHPINPGDPGWGARTFSSNDAVIDGQHYVGSGGHGATTATEAMQSGDPVGGYGYLDRRTSSLRNTAYTSLGYAPSGELVG